MRLPFDDEFRLTQGWGENPQIYKKFGLKAHNGIDWALPTGTPVLAPHSGKIYEREYDRDGYGNYIKIENDRFGSILAHLKKFDVKIGDEVEEGQQIGLSNNTGNSTGPHLHWGLYPKPRNRRNGYSGTEDPFKYLKEKDMPDEYKGLDLSNKESMKVVVDLYDDVVKKKLYVKRDKYDKLSQDYNKLKDSSEARIKAETSQKEELSVMLAVKNDWPNILESVGEMLAAKENKKVEVVDTGHSKICRLLAKVGL